MTEQCKPMSAGERIKEHRAKCLGCGPFDPPAMFTPCVHLLLESHARDAVAANEDDEQTFPMLGGQPSITWKIARHIYETLYAPLNGTSQSLERIAQRGGFGWEEIPFMIKQMQRRERTP